MSRKTSRSATVQQGYNSLEVGLTVTGENTGIRYSWMRLSILAVQCGGRDTITSEFDIEIDHRDYTWDAVTFSGMMVNEVIDESALNSI
jgi:hypothetical protein